MGTEVGFCPSRITYQLRNPIPQRWKTVGPQLHLGEPLLYSVDQVGKATVPFLMTTAYLKTLVFDFVEDS